MPLRTAKGHASNALIYIALLLVSFLKFGQSLHRRSQTFPAFVMSASNYKRREIYNIPGSGWKSPSWNWGYAQGAGHDCAMICRTRWGTTENRKLLLENLLNPPPLPRVDDGEKLTVEQADNFREPKFEEVKLILGLAFQRGRWDGSDGGRGGYSEVLSLLASAERYESDDEEINSKYLIQDMKERFQLLSPSIEAKEEMANLHNLCEDDIDMMRRKCSALVLWQMGFIENGL